MRLSLALVVSAARLFFLRRWLAKLAGLVNSGEASPAITALTLQFFQAPTPSMRTNQDNENDNISRDMQVAAS